jgi:hypothetical protein
MSRVTLLSICFSVGFSAAVLAQTNQPVPPLKNHSATSFTTAENRWQLGAADLTTQQDEVSPQVRTARNSYWFSVLNPLKQVEHKGGGGGYSEPSQIGAPPEIPKDPSSIWVVAKLTSTKVFPVAPDQQTSSEDLILYTELTFTIDSIVAQPTTSSLSVGSRFDVDAPGGRVKLPDGHLVSFLIKPSQHSVQPGHTYLMQIKPFESGDLFMFYRYWDVTSGVVVPDQDSEIERTANGTSIISGKSEQDALTALRRAIAEDK